MKRIISILLVLMLTVSVLSSSLFVSAAAEYAETGLQKEDIYGNQYTYTVDNNEATITRYTSTTPVDDLHIPTDFDGYPVVKIASHAFQTVNAKDIYVPTSVTTIEDSAFIASKTLEKISISQATSIDNSAFVGCDNLVSITIDSTNQNYTSVNGILFNKNKTELCYYPLGITTSNYTMPASITSIKDRAFFENIYISTLTLSSNLSTLSSNALYGMKGLLTLNCSNITRMEVNALRDIPLQNVNLGKKLTTICDYALLNTDLDKITIPKSVTAIGANAIGYYKDEQDSNFYLVDDFTISGFYSSQGQIYANENHITFNPLYDAPDITKIEPNSTNGLKVTWEKYDTSTKYNLYYKKGTSDSWHLTGTITGTSYNYKNLADGTTYLFTVRAYVGTKLTDYYKDGWSYIYRAAPTLNTPSNQKTGIYVSWKAKSGINQYRVYYKEGTSSWKAFEDTNKTNTLFTKVSSGKKYTFTVKSLAADGSFASYHNPTGKSYIFIAEPKITSINANGNSSFKIVWDKVTGAKNYTVFRKTSTGYTKIRNTTATSTVITSAKNNVKYTYTVRVVTPNGKTFISSYDKNGKSIVFHTAPKVSALSHTGTGINVSWPKITGATNYKVYYKDNGSAYKIYKIVNTNSCFFDKVISGHTYTFTAACTSEDGKQLQSTINLTGKSIKWVSMPTLTGITNVGKNKVKIAWDKVNGAEAYQVFIKTGIEGKWKSYKIVNTTSVTYQVLDNTITTDYYVTIRCMNAKHTAYTSAYYKDGYCLNPFFND